MTPRRQSGFTLVESLITVAIVLVVVSIATSATIFAYRTYVGIGNYAQLDRQSREAMGKMERDIRQAAALTNGTSISLNFTNFDGSALWYQYNTNSRDADLLQRGHQTRRNPAAELRQLHVFTVPDQPGSRQLHVVYQHGHRRQLQGD